MEEIPKEKKFKVIDKRISQEKEDNKNNSNSFAAKTIDEFTEKEKFTILISLIYQNALVAIESYKEKDITRLDEAKLIISLLENLKVKTKNNLDKEEEDYLDRAIHSLRLAYLEAIKFI